MPEAVFVRFSSHVFHGINGERHIETRFVRLASRGFDARTGGHARENQLRHTKCPQLRLQAGVREGAPGRLVMRMSSGC